MVFNALTIAGSDSGGGAGIQADLKSFCAMGVFGCSAITAVTAQNTQSVDLVYPIPPNVVSAQIETLFADITIDAIKIGMLASTSIIEAVSRAIEDFKGPIVLDPVMVSKSGAMLLDDNAIDALIENLFPKASLLTPNLPETSRLLNHEQYSEITECAKALLDMGPNAVLIKGGHATEQVCSDWLMTTHECLEMKSDRVLTKNTHGTGCSYSSAIAACLAKGDTVKQAVQEAHDWLYQAILHSDKLRVGVGHGPVHHFVHLWK
ncbi:MAG: bifunctional hydroxymethylpyrimidine kinase/phosphomethylpyrimidine kinase [Aestuariivita sp.]|nr:bifunctional hydroxymethylpyrimidine kinase/phosphomethylpyrimidine kinase [Aestuariivita sp.]